MLDEHLAAVAAGAGRLVLVAGEAGVGKTTMLETWLDSAATRARVLAGACDRSATPRPLGPFVDALPRLADMPDPPDRARLLATLIAALAPEGGRPVILLVEDAHWADEASLDLLRALAVRVADTGALLLVTYRSDEVDPAHPLTVLLGDLAGRSTRHLLEVPALSVDGVRALVDEAHLSGLDAAELHRRTGGNAFYVTEVVESGGVDLPGTVRDAVRARVARLSAPSRAALDVVALAGLRAEPELVEDVLGTAVADVDEAVRGGVLVATAEGLRFRHDLARRTVAADVPPMRTIALHREILRSLLRRPQLGDCARVAHHAEAAREPAIAVTAARKAGRRSADLGAHREAVLQLDRALRLAPPDDEQRLELLEELGYELYLTGRMEDAITVRAQALAIHEGRGYRDGMISSHRWLSRLHRFCANGAAAEAHGKRAVDLLSPGEQSAEAAMALSNLAQLRMLSGDLESTRTWGQQALDMARAVGAFDVVVHTLNNLGTAERAAGLIERGTPLLVESLELALEHNLDEHVARAYSNLVSCEIGAFRYDEAERWAAPGIEFCADRDLDTWRLYLEGHLAVMMLQRGHIPEARAVAERILQQPAAPAVNRVNPLVVLGLAQARTGDPAAESTLGAALAIAEGSGELQRLAIAVCAVAELAWLRGEEPPKSLRRAYELALTRESAWRLGEIAWWMSRAGWLTDPVSDVAEPYALLLAGRHNEAARTWADLGCPYEQAMAHAESPEVTDVAAAVRLLTDMGASGSAARVGQRLAAMGGRVPRPRRRTTQQHPGGLTAREAEVLELVAGGATNGEVAAALSISPRTAEHHVSALLAKLGAGTRREAVTVARKRGWVRV